MIADHLEARGRNWFGTKYRVWMPIVAGACLTAAGFLIWASLRYGSPAAAVAYLQGKRLTVEPAIASFDPRQTAIPQCVEFHLKNWTDRPIRVVGACMSCTCVEARGLPVTIPARTSDRIAVTLRPEAGSLLGDQRVIFQTDCAEARSLVVDIRAR